MKINYHSAILGSIDQTHFLSQVSHLLHSWVVVWDKDLAHRLNRKITQVNINFMQSLVSLSTI